MNKHSGIVLAAMCAGLLLMLGTAINYGASDASPVFHNAVEQEQGQTGQPAQATTEAAMAEKTMAEDPNRQTMIAAMQRLQANEKDTEALLSLISLFIAQEDWGRAEDFARRAVVADPASAQAAYYLGVILANKNAHAEAAQNLERSVRLSDTPQARFSLAVLYRYHLNDLAKARENLEKAAANPELGEALRPLVAQELTELLQQSPPAK